MDQEYHLSFHEVVPYNETGKLKETPENLVNLSEAWHESFNLGVLLKFVKKFLIAQQYSKTYWKKTMAHQNTYYLCSKFFGKDVTGQQTCTAILRIAKSAHVKNYLSLLPY